MREIEKFLDDIFIGQQTKEREDLQYHMEEMIEELIKEGLSLQKAVESTIEAFGCNDVVKNYYQSEQLSSIIKQRKKMRFEELNKLDDSILKTIIEQINDTELWAISLKICTENFKDKILRNMSLYRKEWFLELEKDSTLIDRMSIIEAQQVIVEKVIYLEKRCIIFIEKGVEDVVL